MKQRREIKKICVVDNDEGFLTIMKLFLEEAGYEVKTAEDGLRALTLLKFYTPDVMFIDLIMPNIDGRKLGELIRKNSLFDDVFLIVVSAISPEEEINFAEWGFNACIAKGPIKIVKENVLLMLDQITVNSTQLFEYRILGAEKLFKREITRELLSKKNHFELIMRNMSESIMELTTDGTIIYANPAAITLIGIPEEHLLISNFVDLAEGEHYTRLKSMLEQSEQGNQYTDPGDPITIKGKLVAVSILNVIDDQKRSIIVILNDVTKQKKAEAKLLQAYDQLEQRVAERTAELERVNKSLEDEIAVRVKAEERMQISLEEKEVILKEVHHRVKNNLAVISSLLTIQRNRSQEVNVRTVLQEVKDRIKSIALIHEKLYQSESFTKIQFKDYIKEITNYLFASYGVNREDISLELNVQNASLILDKAMPCAIIINELISNCLRHAFPHERKGRIEVHFDISAENRGVLEIIDDGIPFPGEVDIEQPSTTGLRIIQTLVRQLEGDMFLSHSPEKKFAISFPL